MTERTRKIFDLLGVEPDEKFKIKDEYEDEYKYKDTIFHITDAFYLIDDTDATYYELFRQLLTGEYTIVKLPKTKKLRDLTEDEFENWRRKNCVCGNMICEKCPFHHVDCDADSYDFWMKHKDLYSNKFLDQEIEVEE